MAATLAELRTPITVAEAESIILALLELVGFPATSWQRFSIPRTFVRLFGELYSDARTSLVSLVESRLLDLATGDRLTALALNFFRITRAPATTTIGKFLLTDVGGAPYTIEISQLLVKDTATNLKYHNITGGTLGTGETLELIFQAEATGSQYNIGFGAALEFALTFEGVEVTNPADLISGTWITVTGTDEQSDESLREACRNRWGILGAGTKEAYASWALEGAPTVTKVLVRADEPDGPGTVRVVLATDAGGASSAQVAAADAVVQARRPVGLGGVTTAAAVAVPVVVIATANVYSENLDSYPSTLETLRQTYQRLLRIGESVYLSKLDALLHLNSTTLVRDVEIEAPVDDVDVDDEEMAVVGLGGVTAVGV